MKTRQSSRPPCRERGRAVQPLYTKRVMLADNTRNLAGPKARPEIQGSKMGRVGVAV
jgi:hypothetical protein